ncbi:MAG: 6-carboxytetrahydropterin synthase, partial [Actinomycetota bacterium]
GLGIDFHDIKKATDEILKELDHKNLNELSYFTTVNPSSENIARFIYQRLSERINSDKAKVTRVRVMETSTAGVDYSE